MNYAIIEKGIVVNIIVGLPTGMDGVAINDLPVIIGDSYLNGVFMRDGVPVQSDAQRIAELESALAEIEDAING